MSGKFFIHAANIHQGGGRSLLEPLLRALHGDTEFVLTLDERMPMPEITMPNVQVRRVKPTVVQRLNAERWLARHVAAEDMVLCFGNLPPLFRLRGHTVVFVQNRYLIDDVPLNELPFRVRIRLAIERAWLARKLTNADEFVVQTPTMKRLLEARAGGRTAVQVLPFVAEPDGDPGDASPQDGRKEVRFDFVYVASGEPHKNHKRLLEAWCLLAGEGLFPSLCLTLDENRFGGLCREIEFLNLRHGLKVVNVGNLSYQEVLALYTNAGAAIFPSIFESFGLPLIEARQAGLPLLTGELDYVRDVVAPQQTFDPGSPTSIARAVKRHMGKEDQRMSLLDAGEFIRRIMESGGRSR